MTGSDDAREELTVQKPPQAGLRSDSVWILLSDCVVMMHNWEEREVGEDVSNEQSAKPVSVRRRGRQVHLRDEGQSNLGRREPPLLIDWSIRLEKSED